MSALSGDITVPGAGAVPKKYAAAGVAVVAAAVVIHYRRQKAAAAAAPAAAAGPYPPDGTAGNPADLYSTDPATGQTYGNEQAGAGAGSGGPTSTSLDPYPWDGSTGNPADLYSMDPSSGVTYGNEGGAAAIAGGTAGPPFANNALWSQYAQNYLVSSAGQDAGTVASALGAYLAGQPVTAAQEDIINQAIAFALYPPVAGPNGRPPGINVAGTKTGGTGTAGQPKVSVPDVRGKQVNAAVAELEKDGLKAGIHQSRNPNDTYAVNSQTPGPRALVPKGSTVNLGIEPHRFG